MGKYSDNPYKNQKLSKVIVMNTAPLLSINLFSFDRRERTAELKTPKDVMTLTKIQRFNVPSIETFKMLLKVVDDLFSKVTQV